MKNAVVGYSRGQNKYDNAPAQCNATGFDDFESKVLADRAAQKGLTFICAPLAGGVHYQKPDEYPGINHWRLKDYAAPRAFLPFDFDGFASVEGFQALLAYLARYRGFGYTTASHTAEAPRARAILKASRPVTRAEGIAIGEILQAEILAALGADSIKFDDSVYRGEQPVYTPVITSEAFYFSGAAVDVDALLIANSRGTPKVTTTSSTVTALGADNGLHWPEKINDGEGREDFVLRAAGHLRGGGVPQATIERVLLDYNQLHIAPPLAEATVLNRARRYPSTDPITAANDDSSPEPQELAEHLPTVPAFPIKLLPKEIGAYVQDVAERMSCPVDFPAIAAIVALATAIGSRIHCKPYDKGTWLVPAGAWGMVVSAPGLLHTQTS